MHYIGEIPIYRDYGHTSSASPRTGCDCIYCCSSGARGDRRTPLQHNNVCIIYHHVPRAVYTYAHMYLIMYNSRLHRPGVVVVFAHYYNIRFLDKSSPDPKSLTRHRRCTWHAVARANSFEVSPRGFDTSSYIVLYTSTSAPAVMSVSIGPDTSRTAA